MKLVFDYTYCTEPECYDYDKPFEYETKEKFILDFIDRPEILDDILGFDISQILSESNDIDQIDKYIFTLDEWFEHNK